MQNKIHPVLPLNYIAFLLTILDFTVRIFTRMNRVK